MRPPAPRLGVVALAPVARGIELPASVLVRWDGVEAEGEVAVLPLA